MSRRVLAALFAIPLLAAAPETASPLAWMHGEWSGSGEMFGRPSSVILSVKPTLNGSATELRYTAQLPATDAVPTFRFEGQGIYRAADKGKVEGRWSDSNGSFHPVGGNVSAGRMVTVWGQPSTEIGRSVYELDDKGGLTVSDSVLAADGNWRVFAKASYRRSN
jgi:hypothetical protein